MMKSLLLNNHLFHLFTLALNENALFWIVNTRAVQVKVLNRSIAVVNQNILNARKAVDDIEWSTEEYASKDPVGT